MSTPRTGKARTTAAMVGRNKDMRSILDYLQFNLVSTIAAVMCNFDWSKHKVWSCLKFLVDEGFVEISKTEKTSLGSQRNYYSVLDFDPHMLNQKLSLVSEVGHTKPLSLSKADSRCFRDPLDVALMGNGRAPSLLFKESQRAASF